MRVVTMNAESMLRAYELGESQSPVERALTLLACGTAERPLAELIELPIGQRDALLFELRERTFGSTLRGLAECSACSARLHFLAQCAELRAAAPPAELAADRRILVRDKEWVLGLRLPDSRDLRAAAACGELAAGRRRLIERCLISVQWAGVDVELAEVEADLCQVLFAEPTSSLAAALTAALVEHDPQAEVLLAMICPSCGEPFSALFDIATFLWTEVAAQAQRLISEVDALARAYGWRESDILALSPSRRRLYLSKVGYE